MKVLMEREEDQGKAQLAGDVTVGGGGDLSLRVLDCLVMVMGV